MAQIKLSALVSDIAGKVGGVVFSRSRSGNTLYSHSSKIRSSSSKKFKNTRIFAANSQNYRNILPADFLQYDINAASKLKTNSLGDRYRLNAFSNFCTRNNFRSFFFPSVSALSPRDVVFNNNRLLSASVGYDPSLPLTSVPVDYGLLYNWYAVIQSNFAPSGYRVPSKSDIDSLISFVGGTLDAGRILKSAVNYPNRPNLNTYFFSALPSGYRITAGNFSALNNVSCLYTTSISGSNRNFLVFTNSVDSSFSYAYPPFFGGSVRLLKNSSSWYPGETVTDYDGNIYNTIKIGDQVWTLQNFKCTHLRDGSSIPNLTDNNDWVNSTSPALCSYDNEPIVSGLYEAIPLTKGLVLQFLNPINQQNTVYVIYASRPLSKGRRYISRRDMHVCSILSPQDNSVIYVTEDYQSLFGDLSLYPSNRINFSFRQFDNESGSVNESGKDGVLICVNCETDVDPSE